jgi:hypothetical protein
MAYGHGALALLAMLADPDVRPGDLELIRERDFVRSFIRQRTGG